MPERTHATEQPHSPPNTRRVIATGWIRRAPQPAPSPRREAHRG